MATKMPQLLVNPASGGREAMEHLFPLLPFSADETPMSWAARQAAFHTTGRLIPFSNDLRIPVGDLARGQAEAVIQLCDKAGADPTPVLNNTISAIGGAATDSAIWSLRPNSRQVRKCGFVPSACARTMPTVVPSGL